MRHYDYNDEEDNDNVDKFFEEDRSDYEKPEPVYTWDYAEEFLDPDLELLYVALRICERSWFWRFKSLKTKLTLVATTYATLKKIF